METPTNISYVVGEHAPLAQSGLEQGTFNPRVVGSNPTRRTVVGITRTISFEDADSETEFLVEMQSSSRPGS